MEIKRLMGMFPLILLETLLFGVIVLGLGGYAAKAMYGDQVIGEIRVGIVAENEDPLTRMLIKFVQSMDSIKDTVSFELLPEQEARNQVEEGEIYAAIIVPEGIIDSIISGENSPATILLRNSYTQMETEVFAQLTRSGAKLLTIAQAGIYAADDLCREKGMQDRVKPAEDYLNEVYLKYALGRASIFQNREVDAVNGVGLTDYYGISLVIAFLSFAGLSIGRWIQVRMSEREKLLCVRGIYVSEQYLIGAGAFACVFALLGMVVSLLVYPLLIHYTDSFFKAGPAWLLLIVVWFAVGSFLRMLLQITGNNAGGIGVCFVILMVLLFASGIFVPGAFLPLWIEKSGNYFPFKIWEKAMEVILRGRFEGQILLELLLQILVFGAAGILITRIRNCWTWQHTLRKSGHGENNE